MFVPSTLTGLEQYYPATAMVVLRDAEAVGAAVRSPPGSSEHGIPFEPGSEAARESARAWGSSRAGESPLEAGGSRPLGRKGEGEVVLRAVEIVKRFGSVVANDGVDFELAEAEIHGLLGENGSGKSTFCKILHGDLRPDAGRIYYMGREVRFSSPRDAIRAGIGMVGQELSLIPTLRVSENLALLLGRGLRVGGGELYREMRRLGEEYGIEAPQDVPVHTLSAGEKQRLEILRILMSSPRVMILDEPTTHLAEVEVESLFKVLRKMRERGVSVIFVSHRVDEVLSITDRVTVLRAGRVSGRGVTKELSREELVRMIAGRDLKPAVGETAAPQMAGDVPALRAEDLVVENELGVESVRGLSLDLRFGEVLGVAGIEGNGQKELFEALAGLRRISRGRVLISGVDATNRGAAFARKSGVAYIPEDPSLALVLDYPLHKNLILSPQLASRYTGRWGLLLTGLVKRAAESLIRAFGVAARSPEIEASALSGGNKQRFVLARELHSEPRILIMYNPGKGLDIEASRRLRERILEERGRGKAVLFYSTDLEELFEVSDRILVIYRGRAAALVPRSGFDSYRIAYAMTTGSLPPQPGQGS